MDFEYSTEQKLLRDSVRKLMQRLATPENLRRLDRERLYPYEIYDAWVEAGLFALPFAPEYGGLGGNVLDLAIISEEIGRYSADVAMAFGGSIFCALNVARKGSEEQKRHWLPKLISGEIRMSISMSEPDAGSDVGAMRTQARRDGNGYVISGQKIWATGAGAKNNFINVYVKTDPKAHYRQGMSLFLVDNTTPGLDIRKLDMLGRRSVGTYELNFNDARIPPDRLIGGENKGWECILSGLQAERVVAAACDCGSARGVLDLAVGYAKDRRQFGRAIGTFQAIAHMLANTEAEVEAAWAVTQKAAWRVSRNEDALKDITIAKLLAAEVYVKAANVGMQVMGGFGYNMEFDMQRHFRDARAATIAAGTSEMQRNIIAGQMGLKVQ
ncbi:MAG: acyl-CoA dehydrogenase family protein [Xanthobacteraceae bacterium]|jgi:alkylation response protein AidB-like acyl-CoA dehydrogenase|nr:acyl-CoA dehydrogenase family protein [Xanthobacteraceae bacterium]